jgi:hypothetical protein
MDTERLPDPLISPDVDLRDFPFTPLFRARLFSSEFHAHADDSSWRAGVTLWLRSWDQVPAGSLPDDDVTLCRLAELGRDLKAWKKVKQWAMHGWFKCSDGRLYHRVVAEGVNEAWQSKQARRDRTVAAREARQRHREQQSLSQIPSQPLSQSSVTDPATQDVTASKGQGQGQGQGISSPPVAIATSGEGGAQPRASPLRGSRLARDFEMPDDWLEEAAKARMRMLLPPANLPLEAEQFRLYWQTKSGVSATKTDWRKTWINWALKAKPISEGKPNGRIGSEYIGSSIPDFGAPTGPPPKVVFRDDE